jgi:hypothetical protein
VKKTVPAGWVLACVAVLAFGEAAMAQAESRPAARRPPPPERPAPASRPVSKPTESEVRVARRLGLPVEDVVAIKAARVLSDDEILTMSRTRLDRALERLRKPHPDHPYEWMEWRLLAWRDENGVIPPNAMNAARAQFATLGAGDLAGGLSTASWTELGPGNIGGRVRALAIHPATPTTLFCGSVGGGIWKSVDGGASWNKIDDFLGSISISSIVFQPGNPSILYAGTGESFAGDGLQGSGILKSIDGGATWTQLPSTANPSFHYVNELSISPDGAVLLAATGTGIWRSTNAGLSFTNTFSGTGNLGSKDVHFHPLNPAVAIAEFSDYDFTGATWFHAIAFSTNGGTSWAEAPGTRANGSSARIEVAWHKAWTGGGNGCAYALRNSANGEIFRSLDGGATWMLVAANSILNGTGWYYNTLWVDPTDADANPADDVILAGGLDLWRSTNGGVGFTKITQWSSWPNSPHADQHVAIEDPGFDGTSNRRVYLCNDGGVWRTDNVYTAATLSGWTGLNHQLAITQAYGASRCPIDGVIEMGTQDNGTLRYTPSAGPLGWTTTFGGDGGFCASDPTNPSRSYGEYVRAQIFRSTNGGASGSYIDGWNGSAWKPAPYTIGDAQASTANFIAPFVMDPASSTRILIGGRSLWRTSDSATPNNSTSGPSWAAIKAPTTNNSNISAIAIAATDSNVVWVGHNNGEVWSTANGLAAAPTWTRRDLGSPNLPDRKVTRVTIDSTNASNVLVTFGGFNTDNLWRTGDGGATWAAATGMPAIPLRDVEMSPANPAWLYVASELGLLISEDGGASWSVTNDGPGRASIDEMFWSQGWLYIATHGRGMFKATPHPASAASVGSGCQSGVVPPLAAVPVLTAGPPVLGATCVISVAAAPYPAPGLVFVSAVPPSPTSIDGTCNAYLDLATLSQLGSIPTTPSGGGSLNVSIPDVPSLIGLTFAVQVAFLPSVGGYAVTNGFSVTAGY